jgi:hypothetical protein
MTSLLRSTTTALALSIGAMGAQAASGSFQMFVNPHSAPNFFGSPNYDAYEANVMAGLQTGVNGSGDRSTSPTAYNLLPANATTIVSPGDMIVTGTPSWQGNASPSGALSNELGNRMHFALTVLGDGAGSTFSLQDIGFTMEGRTGSGFNYGFVPFTGYTGANPDDETLFSSAFTYRPWRVGVQYGANGALGGGDDVLLTNGEAGSTPVNALYYFGVGDAYWADFSCTGPGGNPSLCDTIPKRQGLIDAAVADMIGANQGAFFLKGSYYLVDGNGNSLVTASAIAAIPEPSEIAMMLGGVGLIGAVARRRKAKH